MSINYNFLNPNLATDCLHGLPIRSQAKDVLSENFYFVNCSLLARSASSGFDLLRLQFPCSDTALYLCCCCVGMFGYLRIRQPLTVQTDLLFYIAHLFAKITNIEVRKIKIGDALREL